jgi:hypothetical protein
MTVSQILTQAQRVLGNNVSAATLLVLFDARVKELYDGVTDDQMIYFDPVTGRHPFLVTTAGTYQYAFPSWAKYILAVYDSDSADEESDSYPDYPVTADNSSRLITFAFNPGSETTKFKLKGIFGPTDITSTNDSLCVVPVNSRFPLLLCGVISAVQPSNPDFPEARWLSLKEEFRTKLRIGARPAPKTVNLKTEWQGNNGIRVSDYSKRALS